jgi:hypothetical protein
MRRPGGEGDGNCRGHVQHDEQVALDAALDGELDGQEPESQGLFDGSAVRPVMLAPKPCKRSAAPAAALCTQGNPQWRRVPLPPDCLRQDPGWRRHAGLGLQGGEQRLELLITIP